MNNVCPNCHEQAMDPMAKLAKRPFVCRNCGQELRMNLVYSLVLGALYLFVVVRIFLASGLSGTGFLYVLLATAVFIGACLFIPFEAKPGEKHG